MTDLPLFRTPPITGLHFDPNKNLIVLDLKEIAPGLLATATEEVRNSKEYQGSYIGFSVDAGKVEIQNNDLIALAKDTSNFMRGRIVNFSIGHTRPSGEPLVYSDDPLGSLNQIEYILGAIKAHVSHSDKRHIDDVAEHARRDFIAKSS